MPADPLASRILYFKRTVSGTATDIEAKFYIATTADLTTYEPTKYGQEYTHFGKIGNYYPKVKAWSVERIIPDRDIPCRLSVFPTTNLGGSTSGGGTVIQKQSDIVIKEYLDKDIIITPDHIGMRICTQEDIDVVEDRGGVLKMPKRSGEMVVFVDAEVGKYIYKNARSSSPWEGGPNMDDSPFGPTAELDYLDLDRIYKNTVYHVRFYDKISKLHAYATWTGINGSIPHDLAPYDTTAGHWTAMKQNVVIYVDKEGEEWTQVDRYMEECPYTKGKYTLWTGDTWQWKRS